LTDYIKKTQSIKDIIFTAEAEESLPFRLLLFHWQSEDRGGKSEE
jgi:hypothetical protein